MRLVLRVVAVRGAEGDDLSFCAPRAIEDLDRRGLEGTTAVHRAADRPSNPVPKRSATRKGHGITPDTPVAAPARQARAHTVYHELADGAHARLEAILVSLGPAGRVKATELVWAAGVGFDGTVMGQRELLVASLQRGNLVSDVLLLAQRLGR
eukprot:3400756-Pyramimonas_sp.AAC.1